MYKTIEPYKAQRRKQNEYVCFGTDPWHHDPSEWTGLRGSMSSTRTNLRKIYRCVSHSQPCLKPFYVLELREKTESTFFRTDLDAA